MILNLVMVRRRKYKKRSTAKKKKIYKRKRKAFSTLVKRYVMKQQRNICKTCGIRLTSKSGHFHHKDGNRSNNKRLNCVALCPNCHDHITRNKLRFTA